MGMPIQHNIHEPTVASNPVADHVSGSASSIQDLMSQKDDLEAELSALGSVLDSHGVNMTTSLTTPDGFPRADLDVAQIRTTRTRIIHLRNDHKSLMKRIESALEAHFAANAEPDEPSTLPASTPTSSELTEAQSSDVPFAKVNGVVERSPASTAGVQIDDLVVAFGDVNWLNHEKLSKVAQTVAANEGRPIVVKLARSSSDGRLVGTREVLVTPRRDWGGRGLLGCHLVPY